MLAGEGQKTGGVGCFYGDDSRSRGNIKCSITRGITCFYGSTQRDLQP